MENKFLVLLKISGTNFVTHPLIFWYEYGPDALTKTQRHLKYAWELGFCQGGSVERTTLPGWHRECRSSRRFRSFFVANQSDLFQVPASVPCDSFGVVSSFEARYVDILAQIMLARENFGEILAFTEVVYLWVARVSTYDNDVFVCNLCYGQVVASSLGFASGAKDMRVLMWEGTTAVWEQLQISRITSGAVLHAPLMRLVSFHKKLGLAFHSHFKLHLFVFFGYFAGNSQRPCRQIRCYQIVTPLLNCCARLNVSLCHRRSRGRICYQEEVLPIYLIDFSLSGHSSSNR